MGSLSGSRATQGVRFYRGALHQTSCRTCHGPRRGNVELARSTVVPSRSVPRRKLACLRGNANATWRRPQAPDAVEVASMPTTLSCRTYKPSPQSDQVDLMRAVRNDA